MTDPGDEKTTFIYILWDPRYNNKAYIGKADKPKERYKRHLSKGSLETRSKKSSWLKSLLEQSLKPVLEIIDEVSPNTSQEWGFWERYYISLYKNFGVELMNGTDGGDAPPSTKGTKQSLEQIKKRVEATRFTYDNDPESRKRRSKAQIGKKALQGKRDKLAIIASNRFKGKIPRNLNSIQQNRRVGITEITKQGKKIRDFESIKIAAITLGLGAGNISFCLKRKGKLKNHYFKYKTND